MRNSVVEMQNLVILENTYNVYYKTLHVFEMAVCCVSSMGCRSNITDEIGIKYTNKGLTHVDQHKQLWQTAIILHIFLKDGY